MRTAFSVGCVISLSLILNFFNIANAQNEDVSSELQVFRITQTEDGESADPASEVAPGDTLEYRLTYTNNRSDAITNLQPVLPVPQGMWYLGMASPTLNRVSLDSTGTTFRVLPIIRTVTLASGEQQKQEVPVSEYRRLSWMVDRLSAKQSITFTARLKVIDANTF